jgi:hypothetical protein
VGHTGTTDGFHQSFLDDAFFDVEGQFAGTLLGGAPAHTVGQTGNVGDFLGFSPLSFLRDRGGTVFRTLGHADHLLDFVTQIHRVFSFALDVVSRFGEISITAQPEKFRSYRHYSFYNIHHIFHFSKSNDRFFSKLVVYFKEFLKGTP